MNTIPSFPVSKSAGFHLRRLIAGLSLVAALFAIPVHAQQILLNPGLEAPYVSGIATNWAKATTNGATMTCTQDTGTFHGGASSQKVVVGSFATNSAAILYQGFEMVTGHVYQASVWVKSLSGSPPVDVQLSMPTDNHPIVAASCITNTGTGWQQIVVVGGWQSGSDPEIAVSNAQFQVNFLTNGTYWVDDASVTDVTSNYLSAPMTNNGTIPSTYFGMHVNHTSTHWPGVNQGMMRFWDNGCTWAAIQPTGSNDWSGFTNMDARVAFVTSNNTNCQIIYTLGQTPAWCASNTNWTNSYGAGAATPPTNNIFWSNYVYKVASRYKGVINTFETWNESNSENMYHGTIAQLVALTQIARGALDQIDTNIVLIGPNFTVGDVSWLDQLLQAGVGQYVDVISYHLYPSSRPEDGLGSFAGVRDVMSRYPQMAGKPLWMSEGAALQSHDNNLHDDGIVSRSFLSHWIFGAQNFNWYSWDVPLTKDGGRILLSCTNSGGVFIGMTNGGIAYSNTLWWLVGAQMNSRTVDANTNWMVELQRPDPLHSGAFLKSGHVVWNPDNTNVSYSIPASWNVYQMRDLTGLVTNFTAGTVSVGQAPIMLDGKVANAPTGLSATGGTSQVSLSWSAAAGASGYNVKRSTTSNGPYTTITNVTSTSFIDTGLSPGTTYYYVVSATNYVGEGADSTQASAITAPPAPTGLAATGGTNQISLTWNSATGATSYSVKRSTASGGPYTTVTNTTSTADIDTGLAAGTTYYYVVSALDAGGESSNSAQASAITAPPTPTGLAATGGTTQVSLSWSTATGASSYNVKRSTSSGGPYTTVTNTTSTPDIDTGLAAGTTYYYVVSALDAGGESSNSSQASAITAPPAPTGLAATGGTNRVSLSWNAATGASSYNVKRSTVSGGPYTTVTNTTGTADIDTGLTSGTTYYYVVSALDAGGESANSTQASAITAPPTPTGLSATGGTGQVSLSWSAATGAASYNVRRSLNSGGPYSLITNTPSITDLDTGLISGTTFYYVVSAVNAGGESANSAQASAITAPAAPTGLTATPGDNLVLLNWSAATGASSYNVLRSLTSGSGYASIGTAAATSYTDTNAVDGTTYYYVVNAANSGGTSANSAQASATPPVTGTDIGAVGLAGSFTASSGTYTVNGAGADIHATNDSFYFVYRAWTGDVEVVTHVLSVSNTSIYAKAGIMIRETLTTNSAMATADVTPGFGIEFIRRYTTGGTATNTDVSGLTAPYWVKLVRTFNVISSYRSGDGTNWVLSGSDTVVMAPTVYVGLIVNSHNTNQLCTATFTNFTTDDPWLSQDIGATGAVGGASVNLTNDTFTVWGAGNDIYGTNDQFQYVYQPMYTNGQMVAQVLSVQDTSPWAKAGVMIRQSLTTNSIHAMVDMTATNGIEFNRRLTNGGTTASTVNHGLTAPYWVMLTRTNGTNFTASQSPDGLTWTNVGSDVITMTNPVYVGLIVCSHTNGVLCTNVFKNVTFTPSP